MLLKSYCFLVIGLIKCPHPLHFWKVGIWVPVFETQKVHLYKYFCILWAFRILSQETISVAWNFHRSWHAKPSGFCPCCASNLPSQVTRDFLKCHTPEIPVLGSDTVTAPSSNSLWLPSSCLYGLKAPCSAFVTCWGHRDEWDLVFSLREIRPRNGHRCKLVCKGNGMHGKDILDFLCGTVLGEMWINIYQIGDWWQIKVQLTWTMSLNGVTYRSRNDLMTAISPEAHLRSVGDSSWKLEHTVQPGVCSNRLESVLSR